MISFLGVRTDRHGFGILTWKHVGTQKMSTQSSKLVVSRRSLYASPEDRDALQLELIIAACIHFKSKSNQETLVTRITILPMRNSGLEAPSQCYRIFQSSAFSVYANNWSSMLAFSFFSSTSHNRSTTMTEAGKSVYHPTENSYAKKVKILDSGAFQSRLTELCANW